MNGIRKIIYLGDILMIFPTNWLVASLQARMQRCEDNLTVAGCCVFKKLLFAHYWGKCKFIFYILLAAFFASSGYAVNVRRVSEPTLPLHGPSCTEQFVYITSHRRAESIPWLTTMWWTDDSYRCSGHRGRDRNRPRTPQYNPPHLLILRVLRPPSSMMRYNSCSCCQLLHLASIQYMNVCS